jgi:hypothetical protein
MFFRAVTRACLIAALLSLGCHACSAPSGAKTGDGVVRVAALQSTIDGPLVGLSADLKRTDFRLSPPVVRQASARADAKGLAVVDVEFEADARLPALLTVQGDTGPIMLRDDGQAPDLKASDRIYSVGVPIGFDVLKKQERVSAAVLQQRGMTKTPIYDGRTLIDLRLMDLHDIPGLVHFLVPVGSSDPKRTLLVTDLGVVEDATRTFNPCPGVAAPGRSMGKWTFGYLMQQMANPDVTHVDPGDLVEDWLRSWLAAQTVNGFNVSARRNMGAILDRWPRVPGTVKLDVSRAPVRLLAIVNRIDLAGNPGYGPVGGAEGRFVFELLDEHCAPMQFLIILEYGVPVTACMPLRNWARSWRALDALTPGSTAYNDALENLTETFAHANAGGSKTAGSAINQVRTNETALLHNADGGAQWELREFTLQATDRGPRLIEATVKQTPDARFNGLDAGTRDRDLGRWINENQVSIAVERHTVPAVLPFPPGDSFLGAATPNNELFLGMGFRLDYWTAPGITLLPARHKFSLNTCNGCHGEETKTGFTHIQIARFGAAAGLSHFLLGETVPDPVDPTTTRIFGELARRAAVLDQIADSACRDLRLVAASLTQVFPLPPLGYRPTLATD